MRKRCNKCKHLRDLSNFSKHRICKDGLRYTCKKCAANIEKIRYQKIEVRSRKKQSAKRSYNRNKELVIARTANWRKTHPLEYKENLKKDRLKAKQSGKTRARSLVMTAKKSGKLKQEPCVICKTLYQKHQKGQAHHDDYNKPLDVTWLCPGHHMAWHKVFLPEQKI